MKTIEIRGEKTTELPPGFRFSEGRLTISDERTDSDPIKVVLAGDSEGSLEVVVARNAEAKVLVELIGKRKAPDSHFSLSLQAEENSSVKYILIGELSSLKAELEQKIMVQRNALIEVIGGFVSHRLDAKLRLELASEGAEARIRSITVSSQDDIQSIDVFIDHRAKNTYGLMENIGIANRNGQIVLNGVEKIEKGMKSANAHQTLKGIIMSDEALVEVNPILLIDEYDVQAGHGATIGKIEEQVLYYLQSRGLTRSDAERLIINGLIKPVIDEIDDEAVRDRFVERVHARI
ncbi:MAG: SufD family Fe-S cluster assembly protein [Acholeplasmataceae bacterium]